MQLGKLSPKEGRVVKDKIRKAMNDSDQWVICCHYTDRKGVATTRIISPIRFVDDTRIVAICLCREEPRQFVLSRMKNVRLMPSSEVQMPMPITESEPKPIDLVSFIVHGTAKPQGSKKAFMRPGAKHPTMIESAGDALKQWRYSVAQAAAAAMVGKQLINDAVFVEVRFFLPRPKGHFGTGRNENTLKTSAPKDHTKKPDVDKLTRAVCDSLTDRVYKDDAQVTRVTATKEYTETSPRAEIKVARNPHE